MERLVPFVRARDQLLARCGALAETERVPLAQAAGRRLAEACVAPVAYPAETLVAADGLAMRSDESVGASPYNPLPVGQGTAVELGATLPPGADAVAPWEDVVAEGVGWSVLSEIDAGQGVCRTGQLLAAGTTALEAGRVLRAGDLALLEALGQAEVPVHRRPVAGMIVVGAAANASIRLLRALLSVDGAMIEQWSAADSATLAKVLTEAAARVDLLLVVGGTGEGPSGIAPGALEQAGTLDAHGIALRPGRASGVGVVSECPAILVPPEPLAAQAAGELLAGPALRTLAGAEYWPHRIVRAPLSRKAVSALGELGYVRAAFEDARIHPRASGTDLDLPAFGRTDGFLLIEPESEGHPPGAELTLYLDRC